MPGIAADRSFANSKKKLAPVPNETGDPSERRLASPLRGELSVRVRGSLFTQLGGLTPVPLRLKLRFLWSGAILPPILLFRISCAVRP